MTLPKWRCICTAVKKNITFEAHHNNIILTELKSADRVNVKLCFLPSFIFICVGFTGVGLFHLQAQSVEPSKTETSGPSFSYSANLEKKFLPEAIVAKTLLEEMTAKRYTQELSTMIDQSKFSLSAHLELLERIEKDNLSDEEMPPDFLLGTLDHEATLKKYSQLGVRFWAESILANYLIYGVTVSVGLRSDLNSGVKNQVEKWLLERLHSEFGKLGRATVTFIKDPDEKLPNPKKPLEIPKSPETPKTFEAPKSPRDWLDQFQSLAGQIVLALALMLGIITWKLLSSKEGNTTKIESDPIKAVVTQGVPPPSTVDNQNKLEDLQEKIGDTDPRQRLAVSRKLRQMSTRLIELAPKLSTELDQVMNFWCRSGEDGKVKLACYAEAVGSAIGKLPIPLDAIEDLSKVFAQMCDLKDEDKLQILKKVYWDLLAALNLGNEALQQPFTYLGQVNADKVDQMLMNQNSKMRAIVALHMPSSLRDEYIRSLSLDEKQDLIYSAIEINQISSNEFRSFDETLRLQVQSGTKEHDMIDIMPILTRLLEPLSPIEEITILSGLGDHAYSEQLKKTYPTVAFVASWNDAQISYFFARAMPDEVVALLRIRPDLKDRIISKCPPIVAEVASDELSRSDKSSNAEKNNLLQTLGGRLKKMLSQQEIKFGEDTDAQINFRKAA